MDFSQHKTIQVSSPVPARDECNNYFNHFNFECAYDFQVYHEWSLNRPFLPIIAVALYLLMIHYGKKLMENRKPFQAKNSLFLWNASLAIFSIMGTARAFEEVSHTVSRYGFHPSICITNANRVSGFWVFAFMMSKFVELGDTFFLIIRKRNLMFLHWYHHVTVLLFTWYAVVSESSTGRYFITMNFFVHSLMYTYFALQTVNIKAPVFVSMIITTLQILQMVGGIYVIVYTRNELLAGRTCAQTFGVINSGLLMYGSYFVLFLHFFIKAYIINRRQKKMIAKSVCETPDKLSGSSGEGGQTEGISLLSGVTQSLKDKVHSMTKVMKHDMNSNHIKGL